MFKNNKYIISIKEPCSQSWNEMQTTPMGKFCAQCSKNVTDFRHLSDEQIVANFENTNEQICGRFNHDQLNRVIQKHNVQPTQHRLFAFIGSMLLFSNVNNTLAQIIPSQIQIDSTKSKAETRKNEIVNIQNKKTILEGTVVDEETNEVLPFVSIWLSDKNVAIHTNESGAYKLEIPDSLIKSTLVVRFQALGYSSVEKCYTQKELLSSDVIKLKVNMQQGYMGMVVHTVKKRKWWQRK